MSLFAAIARVRAAQLRVALAREELAVPAAALLARGHRYPLSTVGAAAGAGFVLGRLKLSPLRVPGLSSLFSGGMAELVAYGTQLIAGLDPGNNRGGNAADDESSSSDRGSSDRASSDQASSDRASADRSSPDPA